MRLLSLPFWIGAPICVLFVTWPVFVFWHRVALEPAHFIELWLPYTATAIVVIFVVEVVQEQRRDDTEKRALRQYVNSHIVLPLHNLHSMLAAIRTQLNVGAQTIVDDTLTTAANELDKIAVALHGATVLTENPILRLALARTEDNLNLPQLSAGLLTLSHVRTWGSVPLADFEGLIKTIANAVIAIENDTDN